MVVKWGYMNSLVNHKVGTFPGDWFQVTNFYTNSSLGILSKHRVISLYINRLIKIGNNEGSSP